MKIRYLPWLCVLVTIMLGVSLQAQWDDTKPADNRAYSLRDDDIRTNNAAIEGAFDNEHEFNGTAAGTQEGFHRAGSAVAQVADTLVLTRPDGTAFDANDTGRLGIDSNDNTLWFYDNDSNAFVAIVSDINDSATNGDTDEVWSADKVYDQLALKSPLTWGRSLDYVLNVTGAEIQALQCVYCSDDNGQYRKVTKAANTAEATARVIGVAVEDIANTSNGSIITHGYVSFTATDNAASYSDGDELWLGTDGNMVTAPPYGTAWTVKVADVIGVSDTTVILYVDIKTPLPPGERLLGSAVVGMQDADGKTTAYTVPTGRSAIVTQVVLRSPSASLADANDVDFGDGASADTWQTAVDLSGMTSTAHYMVLRKDSTAITIFNAADAFGVLPADGTTADTTVTMDVFGYEF